jgi:hypothetical protein
LGIEFVKAHEHLDRRLDPLQAARGLPIAESGEIAYIVVVGDGG